MTTSPLSRPNIQSFALGYAAGTALYLLLHALEGVWLGQGCQGHTAFALLAPLLLGPGGLALALTGAGRPGWVAFGLGLAAASLFPALYYGAREMQHLKDIGCSPTPTAPAGSGTS